MNTTEGNKRRSKILVVTGEASGDSHAAGLVRALRQAAPDRDFEFFGATGPQLREAGVESVVSADGFAIIGLPEVARALPMFWSAFKKVRDIAIERDTDLAILVDFPEFNLKLAKSLSKRGIKVVYYISPQLWAWRRYRARTIRNHVDLLLSILPFEKQWYAQRGILNVEFVGNPTVAELPKPMAKNEFCIEAGLDPAKKIVALLPGSRHKEVVRILPTLLESAKRMHAENPEIQFVVAMSKTRGAEEVAESLRRADVTESDFGGRLSVVFGKTIDVLEAADAAAVTSGTATLEAGVVGVPLLIVYRSTLLNYLLLRPLVQVDHIGLINLIAGRRLAKEFLQNEFTPEAVSEELFRLMDPEVNSDFRGELRAVTESLRGESASSSAANAVIRILDRD